MILLDFNSLIYKHLIALVMDPAKITLDERITRHTVLEAIKDVRQEFSREYGELVICMDGVESWRKTVFPFYKIRRAQKRREGKIDWQRIHECLSPVKSELERIFPYHVVGVESAEADDVIATLVEAHSKEDAFGTKRMQEKTVIISTDEDYIQLQRPELLQWDHFKKIYLYHSNPQRFLFEHICQGDAVDDIPNIKSPDDQFVTRVKRQSPVTQKFMAPLTPETIKNSEWYRNYLRNEQLIDLSKIPEQVKVDIMKSFETQKNKEKGNLYQYFVQNKLSKLLDDYYAF